MTKKVSEVKRLQLMEGAMEDYKNKGRFQRKPAIARLQKHKKFLEKNRD